MKTKTNGGRQAVLKLNLNKRTVSNLNTSEMQERNGGYWTTTCNGNHTIHCTKPCTYRKNCV